jgi:O-antigen/teichoic acid export membrane protein
VSVGREDVAPATSGADDGHVLDSREAGGRYLRGSGLRLIAVGAGFLVGVAVTPLVVHHLGPVRWGDYGKVLSLLFIVSALTEGGLGQMGLRELSVGDESSHRRFLRELLGLRIALTLIGLVGAIVFGWLAGYGGVVVAGIAIAGLGSLFTGVQYTLALTLGANLRLGWMAWADFVPQLASATLMLVLVVLGAGLLPFYFAPLAAGLSVLVLTVLVVRREVPLLPSVRLGRWRALLGQTFVYAVATATGAAYFRIAMVATSVLSTGRQTGYFGLSFRVLELTTVVPWLVIGSAFPILVRSAWNDPERLRYALGRLCLGSLILGGWFALCLVVGAPFVIHVLEGGGHKFDASIPVLRTLGAAIAATFLLATFSYTLLALQLFRHLIVLNLGIVLLALALSPVLIPSGGAQGAAVLSVILEVLLCAGYAVALFRARPDLRPPVTGFGRIALALGLAFAAGEALRNHSLLGVIVGSVVLAGALLVLRAIPPELLEIVRRSAP